MLFVRFYLFVYLTMMADNSDLSNHNLIKCLSMDSVHRLSLSTEFKFMTCCLVLQDKEKQMNN